MPITAIRWPPSDNAWGWTDGRTDAPDFRSAHWILFREEELELELSTLEWRVTRAIDDDVEVAQVVVVRDGRDAGRRVCDEALRFLLG